MPTAPCMGHFFTCVDCAQKLPSQKVRIYVCFYLCRIVTGWLTGYGLDFLAEKVSGPRVDSATLQLIGVLFASILLPGLATSFMAQQQKDI
eukprot:6474042-Amphidinium_carterae.1